MNFRELASEMDEVFEEVLADSVTVNGRPVQGMFDAPWLEPRLGSLRSAILEPHLTIRDQHAVGLTKGMPVTVESAAYVITSLEPDGTGWTVVILRPDE